MDLRETLDGLADRLESQESLLTNEEATKNALIMPVINALGYNVFDPTEVLPEFTADVGTKKGEKVDYAINISGSPMMLIECKSVTSDLKFEHASQLFRYFGVTDARFAILTNGVHYWFYTDLDTPNRMDKVPFFEFDLRDYGKKDVEEFQKFAKSAFDLDNILNNATELKYVKRMAKILEKEFAEPSEAFVKFFSNQVYDGRLTSAVCEQFSPLVRSAFRKFVSDSMSSRLRDAFRGVDTEDIDVDVAADSEDAEGDGIETTQDEIEGFHIVRAILARDIDPSRVIMRDTKSYCGVLLDNNNRKPICRLLFNAKQKYLGLLDSEKNIERIPINRTSEIYGFADRLLAKIEEYTSDDKSRTSPTE
jgi:hypothetical protein